jgi:hypothetical protein
MNTFRRFIFPFIGFIQIFYISYFSTAQTLTLKVINPDTKSGVVPFTKMNSNRVYIKANRGIDSFLMIMDTYANFTALPKKWVRKWDLPKTKYIYTTRDYQGNRSKKKLHLMDSMQIAGSFNASQFYVNPKSTFNKFDIGYFGSDLLKNLNWKINFKDNSLLYSETPFDANATLVSNFFSEKEFPWFDVSILGKHHKIVVDLGAKHELYLPANSDIGKELLEKYQPQSEEIITGGANRLRVKDKQYKILLPEIKIQGQSINNVMVILSENSNLSFFGCDFLSRGSLILNYKPLEGEMRNVALIFE